MTSSITTRLLHAAAVALGLCANPLLSAAAAENTPPVFIGHQLVYHDSFRELEPYQFNGIHIRATEGTSWADIEPVKGQVDVERFDEAVTRASNHHLDILYSLGQPPQWAAGQAKLDDWARYVQAVATRYKGRISTYEVMDNSSLARLAEMTRIAAAEVKKADPDARIVCPAMEGIEGVKRLDAFLATGAGRACDVIGFHFHLSHRSLKDLRETVDGTRRVAARHGLGTLPVWDTEAGVLDPAGEPVDLERQSGSGAFGTGFDGEAASQLAAKVLVVSHAMGVERTYWSAQDSSIIGADPPGPRLSGLSTFHQSMRELTQWLRGHSLRNCEQAGEAMFCEIHDSEGPSGAIYWGGHRKAVDLLKAGYDTATFLDGGSVWLNRPDAQAWLTRHEGDVVELRRPVECHGLR